MPINLTSLLTGRLVSLFWFKLKLQFFLRGIIREVLGISVCNEHRRFDKMFAKVIIMSLAVISAKAEDKAAEHKFPFRIEVDKKAGKTGAYPNRFKHQNTGMWYVLVPGEKYSIGNDQVTDSKSIEVTLSTYYISETEVSVGQYWTYRETELNRAFDQYTKQAIKEENITKEQRDVLNFMLKAACYETLVEPEPLFISYGMTKLVISDEGFDKIKEEIDKIKETNDDLKLNAEERAVIKRYQAVFQNRLNELKSKKQVVFQTATYYDTPPFVAFYNLDLPTEAQWEVAARLVEGKKLKISGMLDLTKEWCSDFYAHDYFHRKIGGNNPAGPRRARLSREQVQRIENDFTDGFDVLNEVVFRPQKKYRVLRGGRRNVRDYGLAKKAAIRLVYNPKSKKQKQQSTNNSKTK